MSGSEDMRRRRSEDRGRWGGDSNRRGEDRDAGKKGRDASRSRPASSKRCRETRGASAGGDPSRCVSVCAVFTTEPCCAFLSV